MDDFKTVRLKKKTLIRFKRFSKKVSKSYSETMELVIDFFEWHGFLPSDRFEKSIIQEIAKNRKRTEASIAIIKDIEKSQTKPTNAMLSALFGESLVQEEPLLVERKFKDTPREKKQVETTVPKIRYENLEWKMDSVKNDFSYVLDNVKVVKSSFGKNYLRLELNEEELVKFRRILRK
ncbi:BfmA/BtgA family mobilization protein [Flavivirga amylovorans]|uniref:BfmA/BtgA family mobilization protein n=1 Tax=Flavivirga amylovorans TaxID=870486 RepID=A0ABT8WWW5_9FLAO|nr:BfmA/BtgA family mobilization protein [Flavivirga amylovorans]MDO5986150.1 BfmA/BtgA family mobilization protein [Flavivirga amylovorans]